MDNSICTTVKMAEKVNLDGIIDIFTSYGSPKDLRKSIFTIYSTLTQYILSDNENCGCDPEIKDSMYLIKQIMQSCEELDNIKESKLKVIVKSNL